METIARATIHQPTDRACSRSTRTMSCGRVTSSGSRARSSSCGTRRRCATLTSSTSPCRRAGPRVRVRWWPCVKGMGQGYSDGVGKRGGKVDSACVNPIQPNPMTPACLRTNSGRAPGGARGRLLTARAHRLAQDAGPGLREHEAGGGLEGAFVCWRWCGYAGGGVFARWCRILPRHTRPTHHTPPYRKRRSCSRACTS